MAARTSFAARLTRVPQPFDPRHGQDAAALFPDADPEVRALIAGTAGCSPYLAGLLSREAEWIGPAFDAPEAARDAELARLGAVGASDLYTELRTAKRRLALLTALADLGGVWPLDEVTITLSRLADRATDLGMKSLVAAQIARGKLPGLTEDDAETAGGMVALAMGKGGAFELNYSSDIDLILLFDETRFDSDQVAEARSIFVKVARDLHRLLSDTKGGYVFRTDLRLRPDASVTPPCLSMAAAEAYYESVGRTWERAAYIKARAAAGDIAAGERFLNTLTPFIWRKHLDFAAIQDAHDMRLRIRDHKGLGGALTLEGHNVKLGRGGIREIEFFTQTRQLIAGGRDPDLRVRGTLPGLERLVAAGWVGAEDATELTAHYRDLRELEHRLQMIGDAQTHTLPRDTEGFARLAAFMGTDVPALRRTLQERFEAVHALTEDFFAPDAATQAVAEADREMVERWMRYPALRSTRAVEIFKRLRPGILSKLREAARPEEALNQFDKFLSGLPAGVQLFSLFEANPPLQTLIVDICATAPALAQHLSRNAAVLDAVIAGDFFAPWPGREALRAALGAVMDEAPDYEAKLDAARRWTKEWHFRIGVHHLRGLISAFESGPQYADLAGAVVAAVWPVVCEEFSRKHGAPPGAGAMMLGMGSLGAERLNATSDLDLIVIYDAGDVEASDGRRPLPSRTYYARLTQAMVTALSAPMAEGRLYEVDMRLRPSGKQGPVATSITAFERYQHEEAWTWELLALTRARPIAGDADLAARVDRIRRTVIAERGGARSVRADVAEMRDRIAAAKSPQGAFDAKVGPGRLQDIELCAQTAALLSGATDRRLPDQIAAGVAGGILTDEDAATLNRAAGLFWSLQASARLLTGAPLDLGAVGEGGLRLILRETGMETEDALRAAMRLSAESAAAIVGRVTRGEDNG